MPCELFDCCQFFEKNMQALPKAAEYIRNKLCQGDFRSCSRYRIFKEYKGNEVPACLNQSDLEEVLKAIECLERKRGPQG